MKRRIRQVFTVIQERASISYAKIATTAGLCDIDLTVIKATAPDNLPLQERYVHELLQIFSVSPSSLRSFSICFVRRFTNTHCWRVALKSLLLLHRLLQSFPESGSIRTEFQWIRSNGWISFYPCRFRDDSSSASEDYTAFIRSYARLLNEALDCFSPDGNEIPDDEGIPRETIEKLKLLPKLQSVIDRVMDCRPTVRACRSFLMRSAMKYIIRDSFHCYVTMRNDGVQVMENLLDLPQKTCAYAFEIYQRGASQTSALSEFYDWCRSMGFCGSNEYPFVNRIPDIQIRALDSFIQGLWMSTSSSARVSPSSFTEFGSSLTDDDGDKREFGNEIIARTFSRWERFEGEVEIKPLVVEVNENWEDLLDASVNLDRSGPLSSNGVTWGGDLEDADALVEPGKTNQGELQLHNPFQLPSPLQEASYG